MTDHGRGDAEHAGGTACRCGHDYALHQHYRAGSDCATCGRSACPRFRPAIGRLRWLLRRPNPSR